MKACRQLLRQIPAQYRDAAINALIRAPRIHRDGWVDQFTGVCCFVVVVTEAVAALRQMPSRVMFGASGYGLKTSMSGYRTCDELGAVINAGGAFVLEASRDWDNALALQRKLFIYRLRLERRVTDLMRRLRINLGTHFSGGDHATVDRSLHA